MLDRNDEEQKKYRRTMRAWKPEWWPRKHVEQQAERQDLFQEANKLLVEKEVEGLDMDELSKFLDAPAWQFIRRAAAGRLSELSSVLMNPASTDAQMRYAQGAVDSMRWVLAAPETIMQFVSDVKLRQLMAEDRTNSA